MSILDEINDAIPCDQSFVITHRHPGPWHDRADNVYVYAKGDTFRVMTSRVVQMAPGGKGEADTLTFEGNRADLDNLIAKLTALRASKAVA